MTKPLSTIDKMAVGAALVCVVIYGFSMFSPGILSVGNVFFWIIIGMLMMFGILRVFSALRQHQESFELRLVNAGTSFFLVSMLVMQIVDSENRVFGSTSLILGLSSITCIMISDIATKQNILPRYTLKNPLIVVMLLFLVFSLITTSLIHLIG